MAASAEDETGTPGTAASIGHDDTVIKAKLDGLEQRCAALEREYEVLTKRAEQIDTWTDRYSASMEQERKVLAIIELLMRHDRKSRLLLHHVTMFFHVVLIKLRSRGLLLTSVRDLWYKLEEESVSAAFDDVAMRLGFHGNELTAIRLVLGVVHDKHPSHCACSAPGEGDHLGGATSGGGDGDVANLILYLQVQEELDTGIRLALRRALAVSHCNQMPDPRAGSELHRVVSPRFLEQLNQISLTASPCQLRDAHSADDVMSRGPSGSPARREELDRDHPTESKSTSGEAAGKDKHSDKHAQKKDPVVETLPPNCALDLAELKKSTLIPPAEKPGCEEVMDRVYLSPPPRCSPLCDEPWLPRDRSPRGTTPCMDYVIFQPESSSESQPEITVTEASPTTTSTGDNDDGDDEWEEATEEATEEDETEEEKRGGRRRQEALPEVWSCLESPDEELVLGNLNNNRRGGKNDDDDDDEENAGGDDVENSDEKTDNGRDVCPKELS